MANGATKPGPARADRVADELAANRRYREGRIRRFLDSDWEEDSSVVVHAEPGAVVHVGNTGKHQAVKASDPPSSSILSKGAKPLTSVLGAVKGWPQVFALAIIVAGFVAWLVLRR